MWLFLYQQNMCSLSAKFNAVFSLIVRMINVQRTLCIAEQCHQGWTVLALLTLATLTSWYLCIQEHDTKWLSHRLYRKLSVLIILNNFHDYISLLSCSTKIFERNFPKLQYVPCSLMGDIKLWTWTCATQGARTRIAETEIKFSFHCGIIVIEWREFEIMKVSVFDHKNMLVYAVNSISKNVLVWSELGSMS